jgi:hypothetical protein
VALSAQLGTFTDIGARLICLGPTSGEQSWDRITLDAEIGNPPGVNYVIASYQEANLFAYGKNQWLGDFTKIVLTLGLTTIDFVVRGA